MRRGSRLWAEWAGSMDRKTVTAIALAAFMILMGIAPLLTSGTDDTMPAAEINFKPAILKFQEQGLEFDTKAGYNIPQEWRNPGTELRIVQFTGSAEGHWPAGVEKVAGKILHSIGDNAVVVRANARQESSLNNLDYVEWVGPYEPRLKVFANLLDMTGDIHITAFACPDVETSRMIAELGNLGAWDIEDTNYGAATCWIPAWKLTLVARLDSVLLIQHLPEMRTLVSASGRVVDVHDLWDNTISNLPQNIMGQGQIVHVQDTGIDATHRDFTSGPLGNRIGYAESTTDYDYHGTFMTGVIAGNGYDMETYLGLSTVDRVYNSLAASNPAGFPDRMGFAGRAPEATIYSRSGLTSADWSAGYTFGARIFSNSWGPATMGNLYDSTADTFMNANSGALVLFASGSDGPRANTVNGAGNGKLALSVSAFENIRPVHGEQSDDPDQIRQASSRGPVADGRVKPDIVEAGGNVYSTLSDDSATVNQGKELYNPIYPINPDTSDALGDYFMLSGTSVAVAAASGDAVLVRDYLVDVQGISNPHANLMKTLLIHGAEDMGYGYPSFDQGWGRVNVRNSICPAAPNVLQWYHSDAGIASGSWNARITGGLQTWVVDDSVPLKITMTHWDTVGSGTLTYDLDLVVTSPSGVRYEGNAFKEAWSAPIANAAAWSTCAFPSWMGGAAYDWDTADDGGDDINNVEMFRVERPEKGQWNVQVVWKSSTAKPFTIAMTGGFNASADVNTNPYKVSMEMDRPRVVPERDDFGEAVFTCAPGGSVIVPYMISNGGTSNDAYNLVATLPSGFTLLSYKPASPASAMAGERIRGYATIGVNPAVVAGTYTLAIKATSVNDAAAPIAQSPIKFQIDVQAVETPPAVKIADSPVHEDAPSMVSWNSGGVDYVACAYRKEEQFGQRVYFTLSSDGGRTWCEGIPVNPRSWCPDFVGITRATSGPYEGRLMIAYNAWNPDGYVDSISDTRCAYVKVAYADYPYTAWTEKNAFSLGEGVSTGNTYRTVNVNWVPSVNQFYITVEDFGYDGSDLMYAQQNAIACIGKSSSDGGVTWSTWARIDPNVAGLYYFFPSTDIDALGNMFLYYYHRDSSDAYQDRDLTYQYYTGTWSAMRYAWDTTDNLMFPAATFAPQGINGNRAYAAMLKGVNTDGDRSLYLVYTDNPNGNPPTFSTNYGPYGPVISDQDYGNRFLVDGQYTDDGYVWWTAIRHLKYDPYAQPNIFTVRDNDYATAPAPTIDYFTLNSYQKSKQRTTDITEGGGKLLAAWNQMTREADTDIYCALMSNAWQSAADTLGPVVEDVIADRTVCAPGTLLNLAANINDWPTGGNDILDAQYSVNQGITTVQMWESDGGFDTPAEAAYAPSQINTTGWTGGWHSIWVRGQDNQGNWGEWAETLVLITGLMAPESPTDPDPLDGAIDVPLSKQFSVYYDDYENNVGTILYYWKDSPTPFAMVSGVPSNTRAITAPVSLASQTSYEWYATATDATGTTRGPSVGYWSFSTLDNTQPAPPTNLEVYYDDSDNILNWTRSADDGAGANDVLRYNIYRADNLAGPWTTPIGYVQAGTTSYTDLLKGQADAIIWWYIVRAVDAAGNEEQNENAVPEILLGPPYSIDLAGMAAGQWAFLSFPIEVPSSQIESILSDANWGDGMTDWDVAKAWDNVNKKWLSYRKGGTANTFTQLDNEMGFWLHLTANGGDQMLSISPGGMPIGPVEIPLYAGWNMVGYPSLTERTVGTALWGTTTDRVEVFDAVSPYIKPVGSTYIMTPDCGYWVRVTSDSVWRIDDTPPAPYLDIVKTAPATASPGEEIIYTITCTNLGDATAYDVVITETYPVGTTFISSIPAPTIPNNVWAIGTLAPSQNYVITITMAVDPGASGTLVNFVEAQYEDGLGVPQPPASATATTQVTSSLMQFTKIGPTTANPGEIITYTLTYQNIGTAIADNVVITEIYPMAAAFLSAMPAPSVFNNVWNIGSVPAGGSGSITIDVMISIGASGTLVNSAYLDYDLGRVWANCSTLMVNPSMLFTKTAPATANPGETIVYSLTYQNIGTDWAYNATITDYYPFETTFLSAVPMPTLGDNVWHLGAVAPGAMGSVTITVILSAGLTEGTTVTNNATLDYENAADWHFQEWAYASTLIQTVGGSVHNINTDEYFDAIQAAIDDTDTLNGHTITVAAGTYYEHVLINKAVRLVGENKQTTIICANNSTDVVRITASGVELSNFTLSDAGEQVGSSKDTAVELYQVKDCVIRDNIIEMSWIGVWLYTMSITDDNHMVLDNTFSQNMYGVYVEGSKGNSILGNDIAGQSRGIYISASGTLVANNTISGCDYGILMSGSSSGTVMGNVFDGNWYAVYISSGTSNLFYHNRFLNSVEHVYTTSANSWNSEYPSGGNFWDTYSGTDAFSGPGQDIPGTDGFGDMPFLVYGSYYDNYPLMPYWPMSGLVRNVDTDEYFDTVQDAIDDADTLGGHIIEVRAGTFPENILVTKSLHINGAGANLSMIDGSLGTGVGIRVLSPGASVSNFTIMNCGSIGISVEASQVTLRDNLLRQNVKGIVMGPSGSLSASLDSTADFDSGTKSASNDNYEVESESDNPSIQAGGISLGNLYGDSFSYISTDAQTWKWQNADDKMLGNGVRSTQTKNIGVSHTGKGYMALNGLTAPDDIGLVAPVSIDSSRDWDIQIDFARVYAENNNQWLFGLQLFRDWNGTGMPPTDSVRMAYYGYDTGMRYLASMTAGGVDQGYQYSSTSHTSGTLRIAYNTSTHVIRFYYLNSGAWTQLWTRTYNINTWTLKIFLPLMSYSGGIPDIRMTFDNFKFNGGFSSQAYRVAGQWTSESMPFGPSYRLTEAAIEYTGASQGNFIDRVEWLVNGTLKAWYDTDIKSGSSRVIRDYELSGGSFGSILDDYRIKFYFVGDGTGSVSVDNITHLAVQASHHSDVIIAWNSVTDNDVGAEIMNDGTCLIFHNSFIANNGQAADPFGACSWDNGYPEGGNLWSDYYGSDIYSGPGQDLPGSDGIGDTPYLGILGGAGSVDNYPILEQAGATPQVAVSKTVDRTLVMPRQFLNYTIFFNNTGSAQADVLSLLDSLPSGVTFVQASIPPSFIDGQNIYWYFNNLTVGAHSLTFMVQVNVGVPKSTLLSNIVVCDYLPAGTQTQGWANSTVNWVLPPYIIYGYAWDNFGLPLSGATVFVTNSDTGEHLSAITTISGQYSVDLSDLPSGYMNGDMLELTTSNPSGGYNVTSVDTMLFGEQLNLTVTVADVTAPYHGGENPSNGGTSANATPVISVDVTDLQAGVNVTTVRMYVMGFSVMYEIEAIENGYRVSYWHEAGFVSGTVVSCRIVARDYAGNLLDYTWNFTVP